jgi:hypothetical protein
MSTVSPQAKAADQNAAWQSLLAGQLSGVALPELRGIMGNISGMLGSQNANGQLPQDAANLKAATDQLNRGYGQAGFGNNEYIGYAANRAGEGRLSPGATSSWQHGAATSLERDRQSALANLNFMSAQSSMSDYNKLLGLMGQGVQTSLGLAQGYSGASNAAIGGLSNQTQMGGVLGGAAAGAGIGMVGGVPGAIVGGVVGAGLGLIGSQP